MFFRQHDDVLTYSSTSVQRAASQRRSVALGAENSRVAPGVPKIVEAGAGPASKFTNPIQDSIEITIVDGRSLSLAMGTKPTRAAMAVLTIPVS